MSHKLFPAQSPSNKLITIKYWSHIKPTILTSIQTHRLLSVYIHYDLAPTVASNCHKASYMPPSNHTVTQSPLTTVLHVLLILVVLGSALLVLMSHLLKGESPKFKLPGKFLLGIHYVLICGYTRLGTA